MKKLYFTCLTILFIGKMFGQAAVDIPLSATDGTTTYELAVGLDLTATNCIDPQLGEWNINWPPLDFAITFDLTPYGCPSGTNSFKDYRAPGNPPSFPFTGMIEHLLWWNVGYNIPINITYDIPSGAEMYITDQLGGVFLNIGPFMGQGIAIIPGSYTQIFNKAYLRMEYSNIVPVELTSFTTSILQNEKAVQLNWTTATETNNSGFEIHKQVGSKQAAIGNPSEAGTSWDVIGFVPGFGTTTEPKTYSFIDENVSSGTYKYRLKQIDFDGSFEYSNEIEVEVDFTPKEFVLYQNYPNPFNPNTKIKYEIPASLNPSKGGTLRNITLKVYDLLGKEVTVLVNQKQEPGVYEIDFDAGSLSSGIYLYQLKTDDFIDTKKLILLK